MPRPGPRPYECIRRAWHSDRHQPMRGSLIQEIFRMANEVHNPATRSNREWLEKLPLVVLKAEEIIYSKANSEAEYMDLKTLWDRTSEAIDTIIRRDDEPDTQGDLLQPCIEAALNLGCIPRRASRSQRHNNPGCYLSSIREEPQAQALGQWSLPHSSSNLHNCLSSKLESWYMKFVAANGKLNPNQDRGSGRAFPLYYDWAKLPPNAVQDPMVNEIGNDTEKAPESKQCDLSLRLGLSHRVEDESSSCNSTRVLNFDGSFSSSKAKGLFDFVNVDANAIATATACLSKWSSEEEGNGGIRHCF